MSIATRHRVKIIVICLISGVLFAAVVLGVRFGYLDALFLDSKNYLSARSFPRKDIVSVNLSPWKNGKEDFSAAMLVEEIRKIQSYGPEKVVVAIETSSLKDPSVFYRHLPEFKNLYLFSIWGRENAFAYVSELKDFSRHLVMKPTVDKDLPPYDKKVRRLVLSMDSKTMDGDLENFDKNIPTFEKPWNRLDGTFALYGSSQILIRYYLQDSYPEISVIDVREGDLSGKIVILTTNDNYSHTINHPFGRFNFSEESDTSGYFSIGKQLMNTYANIKNSDYIKTPSMAANTIWIAVFTAFNLFLLLEFQSKPKKYLFWSLLVLPVEFLFGFLFFRIFNINFDFSRILIGQLLIQYVGIPIILIRFLRRTDLEKIKIQKKAEREKAKMSFALKLAEAEIMLRIAAKVSHDLRSPVMALQIASGYLEGKIDGDVNDMIKNSAARVRTIADDVLAQYKGSNIPKTVPHIDPSEVIDELLLSYRVLHPKVCFKHSFAEVVFVQMPHHSLQRSLANILNNAIEAGAKVVTFSVRDKGGGAEVRIENDGPPIPQKHRGMLFREKGTFDKVGGTGLGLYQVKTELETYGGSIYLSDREDTEFVMTLSKDLMPFSVMLRKNVVIFELSGEVSVLLEKNQSKKLVRLSRVLRQEDKGVFGKPEETTILIDLNFDKDDVSAIDLLDAVKDCGYDQVIVFSALVDSQEVQRIAGLYNVNLVEKSRLLNFLAG